MGLKVEALVGSKVGNLVGELLLDGLKVGEYVGKHQEGPLVDSYKALRNSYSEFNKGTASPSQLFPYVPPEYEKYVLRCTTN